VIAFGIAVLYPNWILGLLFIAGGVRALRPRWRSAEARVLVTPSGLDVASDRARVQLARADMGLVRTELARALVVDLPGVRWRFDFEDEVALQLSNTLDAGLSRRRSVAARGPNRALPALGLASLLAGALAAAVLWITWPLVAAALVALPALSAWLRGARVEIGLDGVWIRRAWAERFVPVRDIVSIADQGDGPAIELRGGVTLPLPVAEDLGTRTAVEARLKEARDAAIRRGEPGRFGVRPDANDVPGWVAVIESTKHDYRSPSATAEPLEIACDPSASPEDRLAAAIALRSDEDARARLARAIEVTAHPALREALRALSKGVVDIALLERALAPRWLVRPSDTPAPTTGASS
jgi:hypothetical protein